jgi:hypothetical protein
MAEPAYPAFIADWGQRGARAQSRPYEHSDESFES